MTRRGAGRRPGSRRWGVVLSVVVAALVAGCLAGPTDRADPTDADGTTPQGPPTAILTGAGEGPRAGALGGHAYGERGDAAPWIPAAALAALSVAPGAELGITLDRDGIGAWSLRIAPAEDASGATARAVGSGDGALAAGGVRLAAPAAGRWVLEARIVYASGLGDGAYYWLLEVAPP